MLNRTTPGKVIAPRRQWNKNRNPNIEIRNKPEDLNPNHEIPNGLVWNLLIFDHLKLFRISDFEFRIRNVAQRRSRAPPRRPSPEPNLEAAEKSKRGAKSAIDPTRDSRGSSWLFPTGSSLR